MPSSIGHALAGYASAQMLGGGLGSNWPYVLAATTPDLDIVVSVLRDRPVDYRTRRSHSAGAALAAGMLLGGSAWMAGGRFVPNAAKGALAYGSHLALDYFGKEAEDGLPLLWPFSHKRLSARRPVFKTMYSRRGRFVSGLMTKRNLRKIGREIAILAPGVIAAAMIGRLTDSGR